MNEWVEIDEGELLSAGDEVQLYFKTVGGVWLKAAQVALIESRLKDQLTFKLISSQYNKNNIILTVRITEKQTGTQNQIQQAGIITAGLLISIIIGIVAPVIWYLSITKMYKKAKPAVIAGTITAAALSIAAAIALILVILKR